MGLVLCLSVFALTATGVYLLLERRVFRAVIGVALLGHGMNLMVAATGRRGDGPALLPADGSAPPLIADPLPHALLLTAIVISMAVSLYLITAMAVTAQRDGIGDVEAPPTSDDDAETDVGAEENR